MLDQSHNNPISLAAFLERRLEQRCCGRVQRSVQEDSESECGITVSHQNSVAAKLWSGIRAFSIWLESTDGRSFDPYDLWGTRYGLFSRRLYYGRNPLGMALIAPLLLLEILCPSVRPLFVKRQRFATADAQLALAFLNLYALCREQAYLSRSQFFAEHLLRTSLRGYSGHCWGYPFDWQNNHGLWKRDTPFITATPYCFEAFLGLFDATGESHYLDIARSIARFVQHDLHDTPTSPDAAAGSYSPIDRSQVLNASAYRAMVLFEAAQRFNEPGCEPIAQRNLRFILQNQREDGGWLYALDHPAERFIDHFHTCFVLKNLVKINRHLNSDSVSRAIANGYEYYRRELFDCDGLPKAFSIQSRMQLVRLEMYNFAEAITLGVLLQHQIATAFDRAQELATLLLERYQLSDGHFVTRVYRGGWRHNCPFVRWPQSQLYYALTNLLRALMNDEGTSGVPSRKKATTQV